MLGFSAGGNLCVITALRAPPDLCPNFIIPIYPAYLTQPDNNFALRPEIQVTKTAPPTCIIHADDDRISAAASALLYLEYKKHGIPAELHIYSKGGHGFGMKPNGLPVNQWQVRVADWLGANGWLAP
jgi:acetyl esterase/lipase